MQLDDLPFLTRVQVPRERSDTLHRERLVDFLHEQVECRLILVSAPAGYGKTTLLVDFAHSTEAAICWYGLSETDVDLRVFLDYLVASIRQRYPGFGDKTLSLLGRVTDIAKDLSSIVGILVTEMQESIPEYFFIVLDDYHYVDDSPLVNEALDLMLYYLPSNCHIIVSSRTVPKITLSRLAARRMVAGIGAPDLRFTVQEIRDFMRDAFKMLLPEPLAQQLAENSEGWITGIVLSTHALSQGMLETILQARNSGSPVFDYLANEVFSQQPPALQTFLLESSVLRQFSAERCAEVTGIAAAAEILQAVEDKNLFISRLEGSGWYQYHNLFAEYLRHKLKGEFPTRYREICIKAGDIYSGYGEVENAVESYAAAERFDRIVTLIRDRGEDLLSTGRLQTIHRWLKVIPSPVMDANPQLLTFLARVLYHAGELDKALALFDQAISSFGLEGDRVNAAKARAKRSSVLRLMGRQQEAIDDLRLVLRMAEAGTELEAEARKVIGIIHGIEGRFGESITELRRAFVIYEKLGNTSQMAELFHALGMAHYSKADLSSAVDFYRRSLSLSEKIGDLGFAATTLNNIAMVCYRQGDYVGAMEILREALDKVRNAGYLRMEAHVLDSMGSVLLDAGEIDRAIGIYENALELSRRVNELPLISRLLGKIGIAHILDGDLPLADRLIRQSFGESQGQADQTVLPHYEFSAGQLAFHRKDFQGAIGHFHRACRGFRLGKHNLELARSHYHLANAFLAQNDVERAARQIRLVDKIVCAYGGEGYLLADFRRQPEPIEFAISRRMGLSWIERARERVRLPGKPAESTHRLGEQSRDLADEAPGRVQIYSLGSSYVIFGGRQIAESDWVTQITKELFFYIASQPRGTRKDEVVDDLWPDLSPARARSNFHGTLYRLRRATSPDLVLQQGGRYFLNPAVAVWHDAEEFEKYVNQALSYGTKSEDAIHFWEKAAGIYQGGFLVQFYSEWCERRRKRLEEHYLQALCTLARYRQSEGDFVSSASLYEKALIVDPFAEEVHRELLICYDRAGDRPSAIRHYNRLVQSLREELALDPEPETTALFNSLVSTATAKSKEMDPDNNIKGEVKRLGPSSI